MRKSWGNNGYITSNMQYDSVGLPKTFKICISIYGNFNGSLIFQNIGLWSGACSFWTIPYGGLMGCVACQDHLNV
jgi:hypothetical protein